MVLDGSLPCCGAAFLSGASLLSMPGACAARPLLALQQALARGWDGGAGPGIGAGPLGSDPFALALDAGCTVPAGRGDEGGSSAIANGHCHQQREEGGEVARLKRELAAAREQAAAWQALHGELHAFCVESVLAAAGVDSAADQVAGAPGAAGV